MPRSWTVLILAPAVLMCGVTACNHEPESVVLAARAVLPADTFVPGDPVGAALDGEFNGRRPPFPRPPVQGFSSLARAGDGHWLALQDNGFGTLANSPDYPLYLFTISLDLDDGGVAVTGATRLADPDGRLGFPPSHDDGFLYGDDLDPESFARLDDGTLWIGEEFGPWLVHVDTAGRVLEPALPIPVPPTLRDHARGLVVYRSPDHPDPANANLPRSGGIEGLARNPAGTRLYLAVEKALLDDPQPQRRTLLEFDPADRTFTGRHWFYRPDRADLSLASLQAWSDTVLLVVERDEDEGHDATIKRIYRVDLEQVGADGYLLKSLVCDLLDIADPHGVTAADPGAVGLGPHFTFPFVTPECLVILDDRTLLVVNDNNYPFSAGRRPGVPDDSEFIRLALPFSLDVPVNLRP